MSPIIENSSNVVFEMRDCVVEIEKFDKTLVIEKSDNSDFEWELEESIEDSEETNKFEQAQPKKRRKKRYSTDEDYVLSSDERKQQKTQNYIRYIRQCDLTPEILASNKQFVTIDGIEYKIPKRPLKAWSEQSKKLKPPDPNKRPHRAHDVEGEEKIRNFVDIKCHVCDEQFDAFWRVRKHFKNFHPEQKGYVMCCNRKFTRRYALLDHIEWHDRSKVHSCEVNF